MMGRSRPAAPATAASSPRATLSRLLLVLVLALTGAAAAAAASTARYSFSSRRGRGACLFVPPARGPAPVRGALATTAPAAVRTTTAAPGPLGFVVARRTAAAAGRGSLVRRAALPPTVRP